EKILNRLKNIETREEQSNSSSGFHFLKIPQQTLLKTFEEKLTVVDGVFMACKNNIDFEEKLLGFVLEKNIHDICCIEPNVQLLLPKNLNTNTYLHNNTQATITGCEYLIAQTGSAIVSTSQTLSRRTFAYPPIHIIIAFKDQLIGQLEDGLVSLNKKYKNKIPSQITTITGPSRTADIEKTLVLGAHGPKELIIFYIDESVQ
nr:LUD domain-containing protein [Prolixibacteraceae bacterium]